MTSLLCGIEKHQTQKNKVEWGLPRATAGGRKLAEYNQMSIMINIY